MPKCHLKIEAITHDLHPLTINFCCSDFDFNKAQVFNEPGVYPNNHIVKYRVGDCSVWQDHGLDLYLVHILRFF